MTMAMAMTMTAQFCSKPMAVSSLVSPPDDAAMQAAPIEKVELRMETVSKNYGGRRVVDAISMSVRQGEVVGLLGPNGAGKEASVFRGLSVHDNIRLILQETGVPRAQHARRVRELLEKFALQAVENTMGSALSGGERRRTELARVLASNCAAGGPPKILLVDEPFAGVDPIGVAEMQKQLRRLCEEENMGIMITDHNVNETLRICDRAYMVYNGCVMASGGPEELYQDLYVKKYYLGGEFSAVVIINLCKEFPIYEWRQDECCSFRSFAVFIIFGSMGAAFLLLQFVLVH